MNKPEAVPDTLPIPPFTARSISCLFLDLSPHPSLSRPPAGLKPIPLSAWHPPPAPLLSSVLASPLLPVSIIVHLPFRQPLPSSPEPHPTSFLLLFFLVSIPNLDGPPTSSSPHPTSLPRALPAVRSLPLLSFPPSASLAFPTPAQDSSHSSYGTSGPDGGGDSGPRGHCRKGHSKGRTPDPPGLVQPRTWCGSSPLSWLEWEGR